MYSIQHYVIKFISDLRQVGSFFRFPPPIKPTATNFTTPSPLQYTRLWSWSYSSWIYSYLCNQYISPLTLWVWNPLRQGVFDTTLCDKVYHWPAIGRWFSPVSSSDKTDRHDIDEILLKVALNTIAPSLGKQKNLSETTVYKVKIFLNILFFHRE